MHEAENSGFQSQTLAWSLISAICADNGWPEMQHENSEA
jgi:hypothetical protein